MFSRPLEPYRIFQSTDLDETRELTSQVLCDHYLDVLDQTCGLNARLNSTRIRDVGLIYVEYDAPVLVDPGETESFLVVQGHLNGRGVVRSGGEQIAATKSRIVVSSPDEPLRMVLSADTELILAKIGMTAVRRVLTDLLGDDGGRTIRFELGMSVSDGMPRRWYSSLLHQISRVTRGDALLSSPWWAELFEEALISQLLHLQPSNYSERLNRGAHPVGARIVGAATEVVRGRPEARHTPHTLARVLGVRLGDLDAGFRNHRGVPLADFLTTERLRGAYDQLCTVEPGQVRLSDVARHWGFADPIQFASRYAEAFGETPEQTLHR
ncbi:transcriptional regulator [Amycolatopsis deserti]|uniref:Transcriptional regulator n=1 Tax=Amycolatopsis deserti TaxID=185696 RepID=A0ABQ3J0G1_9PSEU|nr:AraC family transcriptional regulator [Amycolatopsis deserti]GHE98631.1 transcriptional regulator [Amycolatopsis deserti]